MDRFSAMSDEHERAVALLAILMTANVPCKPDTVGEAIEKQRRVISDMEIWMRCFAIPHIPTLF